MNSNYETFWDCDESGETIVKPGYSFAYVDDDEVVQPVVDHILNVQPVANYLMIKITI